MTIFSTLNGEWGNRRCGLENAMENTIRYMPRGMRQGCPKEIFHEYLRNAFWDTLRYTYGNTFEKTSGKFCSRVNTQMNLSYKLSFVWISLRYFNITDSKYFMINLLLSAPLGMTHGMIREILLRILGDVICDLKHPCLVCIIKLNVSSTSH